MIAAFHKHVLKFKKPAGTSRGILHEKPTWLLTLRNPDTGFTAVGECGMLPGLSADDRPGYEKKIAETVKALNRSTPLPDLTEWPSVALGLDTLQRNYACGTVGEVFPSPFSRGRDALPINGLVWMGEADEMRRQIDEKLAAGFRCIKLKIGAIDFETELGLLAHIRSHFPADRIEIRVDANGAFGPEDVEDKLDRLAKFDLHSIEQPIKPGQTELMAKICKNSPVPVALDEELIGCFTHDAREDLIREIKPFAVVLKPSFLGDFAAARDWIALAEANGATWWITSALESNVGLNAIAQFTYTVKNGAYQGLGTGGLYTNNFDSPLRIREGHLEKASEPWNLKPLL